MGCEDRPSHRFRADAAACALLCAAAFLFTAPLLRHFSYWSGNADWQFITAPYAASRNTIVEYHQFPLWMPFIYGGTSAIGYPRGSFLSPLFAFVLAFGVYPGIKLKAVTLVLLGVVGMYRLGRRLKMSPTAAALATVVFCLNSAPYLWLYCGAPQYMAIFLLPWVFQFYMAAVNARRPLLNGYVAAAGLCFLWMFLEGAVYYTQFTALLLALLGLLWTIKQRRWQPIATTVAALVLAGLLGSVKVSPVFESVVKYPRPVAKDLEYITPKTMLVDALFSRNQFEEAREFTPAEVQEAKAQGKVPWSWWEYGAYIGIVPGAILLTGIALVGRTHWELVVVAALFMLCALGYAAPVNLWALMKWLPGYGQMQFPTRIIVMFIFVAAILIGLSIHRWEGIISNKALGPRWTQVVMVVLVAGVYVDVLLVNRPTLTHIFNREPRPMRRQEFAQTASVIKYGGYINSSYIFVEANLGAVLTQVDLPVPRSVIPRESLFYRGEAFLRRGSNPGTAEVADFSPNRIEVGLHNVADDWLVLNQNYDDGWRAKVDGHPRPVVCCKDFLSPAILGQNYHEADFVYVYIKHSIPYKLGNGLVAVPVRKGETRVEFYYSPRSFWWGLAITLGTIVVLLVARFARSRRKLVVALFATLILAQSAVMLEVHHRCHGWQAQLAKDHAAALSRSSHKPG